MSHASRAAVFPRSRVFLRFLVVCLCVCVRVSLPCRSDTLADVSKSYKKALLRIHPDKHMDNESKHLRATEVFKYVSQAFNDYKKKYDK